MDTDWLRTQLMDGRSYESIARDVRRHPSTVAYWARKIGCRSEYADRHSTKGGIERRQLESLIESGQSIRSMATHLGLSYQAVRYWLTKHGLTTPRGERLRATGREALPGMGELIPCPRHGLVAYRQRADNGCYRCLKCRADAVVQRRRRVKATLVAEHGGRCVICGFDAIPEALQFHHVDPSAKSFALCTGGLSRSLARARAEAAKCVLLCANCHAAVEAEKERLTLRSGFSEEVVEN